jgi:5'-nucleotidase
VLALITNDDGVGSLGIRTLAGVAVAAGLEVVVAAPSWDSSGASASLTAVEEGGRFLVEALDWSADGAAAYAVEAAPAYIVRAALTGAFGDVPDVVLSGVNHGPNTGHAILHSGTVGAALTASTHGRRAMAVSIGVPADQAVSGSGRATEVDAVEPLEAAAAVAGPVLRWLLDAPAAMVLNVNVPHRRPDEVRGLVRARLAPFGAVQATVTERGAGYVKLDYRAVEAEAEPGTDAALLAAGWATVTPVLAVCEAGGARLEGLAEAPPGDGAAVGDAADVGDAAGGGSPAEAAQAGRSTP